MEHLFMITNETNSMSLKRDFRAMYNHFSHYSKEAKSSLQRKNIVLSSQQELLLIRLQKQDLMVRIRIFLCWNPDTMLLIFSIKHQILTNGIFNSQMLHIWRNWELIFLRFCRYQKRSLCKNHTRLKLLNNSVL